MATASSLWHYRGRRLKQLEWGLWRDLDRPGHYFLCYRTAGRTSPCVRRWVYADGLHLTLDQLRDLVRGVRASANARKVGIPVVVSADQARADYLDELRRRNRTTKHVEDADRWIGRFLDATDARTLSQADAGGMERFLVAMQAEGLGPRSLNKARSMLSGWFAWAVRRGHMDRNPALQTVRATEIRRLPHFPAPAGMAALVAASPRHDAAIWCLLAFTGLRMGSFLSLDAAAFRDDGILVRHTKRQREWWLSYDDGCPLWGPDLSELGRLIWTPVPPGAGAVRQSLNSAVQAGRLSHMTAHGFRHAFCSWLTMMGESLQDVAAWAHHSTAQTTEKWYAHLRPRGQVRADSNRTTVLTLRSQCVAYALGQGGTPNVTAPGAEG